MTLTISIDLRRGNLANPNPSPASMLDKLPPENVLEILSYLPVQSLRELQLISRDWRSFISTNESIVYKKAALLHGYLLSPNSTSVSDLRSVDSRRSLETVHGWRDLCEFCCDSIAICWRKTDLGHF